MDRPHFAEQSHEFQSARRRHSRCGRLCLSGYYRHFSQQPRRRNGDIRGFDRLEITMEVEMKIRGLMMDPVTNMPIVVLKDPSSEAVLPIWVGIYEANAIALEIEKVATPRPMTHDLIKNVLTGLDSKVHKVVVTELRDDTFFAVIWIEREGRFISIDSRPSDALAIAMRLDCPIFVEDEVLKSSKLAATVSDRVSNEELRKLLENM